MLELSTNFKNAMNILSEKIEKSWRKLKLANKLKKKHEQKKHELRKFQGQKIEKKNMNKKT